MKILSFAFFYIALHSFTLEAHCSKWGWVKTPYGRRCMVPTPKPIKPFKIKNPRMKTVKGFDTPSK